MSDAEKIPHDAKLLQLTVSVIRTDGDTQSRAVQVDAETESAYAEDLANGAEMPPLVVFYDCECYWLASGFHRLGAHKLAGRATVWCHVIRGGREEARLFAAGCNTQALLRRTRADKRRAVIMVLQNVACKGWKLGQIAEHVHVSKAFVVAVKESLSDWQEPEGLYGRDGTVSPPSPESQLPTRERARRAWRKFERFARELELHREPGWPALVDLLERVLLGEGGDGAEGQHENDEGEPDNGTDDRSE